MKCYIILLTVENTHFIIWLNNKLKDGIMTVAQATKMIEFRHILPSDRALYEAAMQGEGERGCEFSFVNLYLWGRQRLAVIDGQVVLFSQFDRRSVYPYPVGDGDKKAALDAIIADARARDIPCRITGLNAEAVETLKRLYPNSFRYHCDEGSFDYVYSIDDLADLNGKKYHGKRNHLNRFYEEHPHYSVQPLCEENLAAVRRMVDGWFSEKIKENPNSDYQMEQAALEKALCHYSEIGIEGLVLLDGEAVLGVTLGSRMSQDTFDVHFEKALSSVQGAYTAIDREFALYIRKKHPEVRYLNREEDMGIEGLRRAKRSYHPHHMVEKCWAHLMEDGYDY